MGEALRLSLTRRLWSLRFGVVGFEDNGFASIWVVNPQWIAHHRREFMRCDAVEKVRSASVHATRPLGAGWTAGCEHARGGGWVQPG
jgi:hypothetical protein